MSDVWLVVICIGAVTVACKAAGPVLLGSRPLSGRTASVVGLVAPVLLVALVITQTVAGDRELVFDERLGGVAAGGIALWRGVPLVPSMAVAAVVTALLRVTF